MENQARIFDAVAEATRQEVLQPIPADVLRLVPEVSLAHALDIIRLSKVTSWRERLGGKNIRAAQCETTCRTSASATSATFLAAFAASVTSSIATRLPQKPPRGGQRDGRRERL